MSPPTVGGRRQVVVCGTKFGRIYLAATARPDSPYELAGVLARGSERSTRIARHYGVPLFTDPEQIPKDVEACCVVVGAGINGGPGARLAEQLMGRGHHVLQEHPLHGRELTDCLRTAREHRVAYRLNTHYVHVEPVRRFIATGRRLLTRQRALHIDAACAFQVLYTLLDILGRTLGGVRPWAFGKVAEMPEEIRQLASAEPVHRSLDGVVAGVPCTLRLQNDMDPADPDNHTHLFHRITLYTEGGNLTLLNTHGPLLWSPRPHMPHDMRDTVRMEESAAAHFGFPSARPLGPETSPDYREILRDLWPQGAARALQALRHDVEEGADPGKDGQYHLTLCRLTRDITDRFGPVRLHRDTPAPQVLAAADLTDGPPTGRAATAAPTPRISTAVPTPRTRT